MSRKRGSERVVRQLMDLKLGYLKLLNIMNERKTISGGSTQRQLPIECSPSRSQSMKRVSEAMRPAAAGIGKPLNSLLAEAEFAAARQLKRASRRAPQAG